MLAGHLAWPVAVRNRRPGSGHFQQTRHPLEVIDRRFDHQTKLRPDQANAADDLAAHLGEAGKDMFDPSPGTGHAFVPGLVPFPDRLAGLPLALDMWSPADQLEPALLGFVVIPAIRPDPHRDSPSPYKPDLHWPAGDAEGCARFVRELLQ